MNSTVGIHWFRRDLRVAGNPALKENFRRHNGRVVGLFCFDSKFLRRADFSHNRFAFFLQTMKALKNELQNIGSDLYVVDALPQEAIPRLIKTIESQSQNSVGLLSFNRDYEPFARQRDQEVTALMSAASIEVYTAADHLLIEPQEIQKDKDGGYYQVYSPFARRWFEKLATADIQERLARQSSAIEYLEKLATGNGQKVFKLNWAELLPKGAPWVDSLDQFATENAKSVTIQLPPAGSLAAWKRLNEFRSRLNDYGDQRDFPDRDGTSQLAIYFKNGSLTTSQVIAALNLAKSNFADKSGAGKYIREIAWREFYYHILYHCPRVENEAFLAQYKDLKWENNKEWFEKWTLGMTGYPIVDAGMRQLLTTGWMHNRVRMIVASFLTKDLLIDWRWGENHFMKYLLDGDLAPNNGGWQWAASTGCDPQPYFRIFNPVLQSERFDPEGTYIKKFVPELRSLSAKLIHNPESIPSGLGYPKPIVNHATQKIKALALFKRS